MCQRLSSFGSPIVRAALGVRFGTMPRVLTRVRAGQIVFVLNADHPLCFDLKTDPRELPGTGRTLLSLQTRIVTSDALCIR
jgi:hypothetical protein